MKKLICKIFGHNHQFNLDDNIGRLICSRCGHSAYKDNIEVVLHNYVKDKILLINCTDIKPLNHYGKVIKTRLP